MDRYPRFGYSSGDGHFSTNPSFQQPQAPFHQHQFSGYSDASGEFLTHGSHFALDHVIDPLEDFDDVDADGNARLTHDQTATLETEFGIDPKPKTEQKSEIAKKLHLGLPRVNVKCPSSVLILSCDSLLTSQNWYQNRRAKAKYQKNVKDREGCSIDGATTTPERTFGMSEFETQHFGERSSLEPTLQAPQPLPHGVDLGHLAGPLDGFDFGLDPEPENADLHQDGPAFELGLGTAMSSEHAHSATDSWPGDDYSTSLPRPFVTPTMVNQASNNHSPQSSNSMPAYDASYNQLQKGFDPASISFYNGSMGNTGYPAHHLANDSSDVDLAHYLTPPHEPHALTWMSEDMDARRPSETSDLANTFASNCHVRGLTRTTTDPLTIQTVHDVSTPLLTPDISPAEAVGQALPFRGDLAARRKAQRPAPLHRPSASRSQSYGALPSMSPRGKNAPHTLRTSQSQSVLNGRVSKPSSAHASPRHHHTQFETRPHRDGRGGSISLSNGAATSLVDLAPFPPPSSAGSTQSYQQWSRQDPSLAFSGPQFYSNPTAFSSVPDLTVNTAQPPSGNFQDAYDTVKHAQQNIFDCPQSAPSHQTTFDFSVSPVSQADSATSSTWLPSHPSDVDYGIEVPSSRRSDHSAHNSFSSSTYQPPFAPKTHFGILPGNTPSLGSSSQHLLNFASVGSQPAPEFKTELETKPGQIFVKPTAKDFNFSNSTPRDFNNSNGKKK